MESKERIVDIEGLLYFRVHTIKIHQNNIVYYISSLTVKEILKICAFMPAQYNETDNKYTEVAMTDAIINPSDLIQDNSQADFNRKLDKLKVDKIYKYAKNNNAAFFPNSLILASHKKEEELISNKVSPLDYNKKEKIDFNQLSGVYFFENYLYIPIVSKSILIVDGQHRIAGLSKLSDDEQKNIELPITLVAGQSNAILSKMFYKINSTQKAVNASVLEYMTNLFLTELSEAKMHQEFIRILNDNKKSPLYHEIKMFGVGSGLISFATLHASLMNMTLKVTKRSSKIPIFRILFNNEKQQYIILNLIVHFFAALRSEYSDSDSEWNKDIVFTKTIGLVALLQLFPAIILKIMKLKYQIDTYNNLENIKEEDFAEEFRNLKSIDVSKYKKAGSMGLSKTLRDEIIIELDLSNYNSDLAKRTDWLLEYYN